MSFRPKTSAFFDRTVKTRQDAWWALIVVSISILRKSVAEKAGAAQSSLCSMIKIMVVC